MLTRDFQYELPESLIAQAPLEIRSASRMLVLDCDRGISDRLIVDLPNLLNEGDLLVFNDTRVIPARLHGHKVTGGRIEVLIERMLDERKVLAHVRASKSPSVGTTLLLENVVEARVLGRNGALFILEFLHDNSVSAILERHGHMPLPPYIHRQDTNEDRTRYQTIFARCAGAVAAPTAGLHFDQSLVNRIHERGVEFANVTLHVGAGTFQPVRVSDPANHQMHAEYVEVSEATCEAVRACHDRGGRVIAVGTTCVRSLESAAASGTLHPFAGDTRLFITPGYRFNVVDALLTNFHLPQSTLLMLVCAFAGFDQVMGAYRHAVAESYRFFSYGDAMFLTRLR